MRKLRLWALGAGHLCVDAYATMIWPMVVYFADRYHLSVAAASWLPVLSAAATSFVQPLLGYWGDRGLPRWVSLSGLALAGVGISLAIAASSVWLMAFWLVVSGLGVAMYHPEAVVLAGDALGGRRSFAIGVFLLWGTMGLGLGPLVIPRVNQAFGPERSWLIALPAVALAVPLLLMYRGSSGTARSAAPRVSLSAAFAGRMYSIALLVGVSSLRGFSMAGVCLALSWLAKQRGGTEVEAGTLVAVYNFAAGLGAAVCGLLAVERAEKPLLVITMVLAMPLIWVIPRFAGGWLVMMLVLAGVVSNATVPVVIAISQRMVPSGARVASSLMMGLSWGVGGMAAAPVVGLINRPEVTFPLVGLAMVPAAVCAALVPWRSLQGPSYQLLAPSHK